MPSESNETYNFLLDTYETETLKTLTIWSTFPDDSMDFRPAPNRAPCLNRSSIKFSPKAVGWSRCSVSMSATSIRKKRQNEACIGKYKADAARRLEILRTKPDGWWRETAAFFDVPRSRAWIFTRRLNHSTHHRGQLIVYLRLLGARVPSVYGPTADTGGKVIYKF